MEQQSIQQRTARIVQVLGAFEESAADSIAQTVFACADGNANECVNQTARFLNHVDSLFQAIDDVETKLSSYGDHRVLQHDREPKDLSKQLVALFTLLSAMNPDTALSSRTIVTELARLLKYMITVGLRGAIKLDRMSASTAGLERFLDLLETATGPVPPARPPSPVDGSRVRLPATFPSTDLKNESCTVCQLPVEEDCIKHGPLRWHGKCFSCAGCGKSQCLDVASAALEPSTRRVFCASCAASKPGLIPGFESVSQLQQYVFLLRLGLSRLCNVFNERGPAAAADAAGRLTPTSLDPQGLVRRSSRKSRSVSGLDQILEPSSELTRSHRATPSVSPQAGGLRGRSPRPGENKVSPQQPQPLAPEAQQSVDLAAELDEKFARINLEIDQAEVDGDGSSDDERGISIPGPGQSLPAMVPPPYEKPAIQVLGGQRFLSELSPLDVVTLRSAVVPQLAFLLDPFMDLDQLLDMIEGKRNTIWDKIVSSFKVPDKKKVKEGTFGVPLQELIAAHGVRTDLNPGPGSVVIPRFIDATIRSMRSQDLRVEGIFRKNGNIRRLKATVEELDRDGDNVACLQGENVVQLAALLRRFLRDMPDPLMTFDLFKIFTTSQSKHDWGKSATEDV